MGLDEVVLVRIRHVLLIPPDLQRVFAAPGTDMNMRRSRYSVVAHACKGLPGLHDIARFHDRRLDVRKGDVRSVGIL